MSISGRPLSKGMRWIAIGDAHLPNKANAADPRGGGQGAQACVPHASGALLARDRHPARMSWTLLRGTRALDLALATEHWPRPLDCHACLHSAQFALPAPGGSPVAARTWHRRFRTFRGRAGTFGRIPAVSCRLFPAPLGRVPSAQLSHGRPSHRHRPKQSPFQYCLLLRFAAWPPHGAL